MVADGERTRFHTASSLSDRARSHTRTSEKTPVARRCEAASPPTETGGSAVTLNPSVEKKTADPFTKSVKLEPCATSASPCCTWSASTTPLEKNVPPETKPRVESHVRCARYAQRGEVEAVPTSTRVSALPPSHDQTAATVMLSGEVWGS